jgi:hypothetical protein
MKPLIVGVCTILLYCFVVVTTKNINTHERQNEYLKFVCDETACSAALFYDTTQYGEGRKVFNVLEGKKAIEYQMKYLLLLDNSFNPLSDTYWQDKISYKSYFYDDSNTTYPYTFIDSETGYTKVILEPTVIVTINAGKSRYSIPIITSNNSNIRSGSFEWQER